MRRRWLGLASALVVLLGAAGLLGAALLSGDNPLTSSGQENLSRAEIASLARVTLPAGASNVHALAGGFQDRFIHLRFDLPASDLPALVAAQGWPPLTPGGVVPFQASLEPQRPWWQPRQAERFLVGGGAVANTNQSVLIDITDPNTSVVYLATFEQ